MGSETKSRRLKKSKKKRKKERNVKINNFGNKTQKGRKQLIHLSLLRKLILVQIDRNWSFTPVKHEVCKDL